MLNNIFKCNKCNRVVISEERKKHRCKKLFDYKFEDDLLLVNDGERWYPLKWLTPKNKHPFKTPEDSTEPKSFFFDLKSIVKYLSL